MSNIEKARIQRDAQQTAATRPPKASPNSDQAILRHLAVELYRARQPKQAKTDSPTDP